MPTNREKLNAEIEIAWASMLGAVQDRELWRVFKILNQVKKLIKERDIQA